ncbi:hypothetical protein [Bacillus sp. Cr_A10]|uniref:hypothetical protein n=1 Tax=Bacillus sp. Cr_A10 TaxID=3033993 RepID=UPI0023DB2723|nr:hypothetical protein [Bacillus sp. Cr_A10]MDF2068009.1 hypothetical protein [Bacillus sp. Cr_A10]
MGWTSFINSMEPGDWGTILAAAIAFVASIFTIASSTKSARKSNELNEKLGKLQANTQDKQRIVETIGAQRVVWINNIRQHFVDYNSNAQKLHFNYIRLLLNNEETKILRDKAIEISEEMVKTIHNTELFLNGDEIYSNAIISIMKKLRNDIINLNSVMSVNQFNDYLKRLLFAQNVILKAEWKRVKEETSIGDFLSEERVKEIFVEVATKLDEDMHNIIIENYSN